MFYRDANIPTSSHLLGCLRYATQQLNVELRFLFTLPIWKVDDSYEKLYQCGSGHMATLLISTPYLHDIFSYQSLMPPPPFPPYALRMYSAHRLYKYIGISHCLQQIFTPPDPISLIPLIHILYKIT